MVLVRRVVLDACFGETVSAIHRRKIPAARKAISRVVHEKRLRARRISQESFRACGPHSQEIWFRNAPLGRRPASPSTSSTITMLGRRRDQRRSARDAFLLGGITDSRARNSLTGLLRARYRSRPGKWSRPSQGRSGLACVFDRSNKPSKYPGIKKEMRLFGATEYHAMMTLFWKRRAAMTSSMEPKRKRAAASIQRCTQPAPRRIMPRVMSMK
jgi:hypothetical protein